VRPCSRLFSSFLVDACAYAFVQTFGSRLRVYVCEYSAGSGQAVYARERVPSR